MARGLAANDGGQLVIRPVIHVAAPPPRLAHTDAMWQEAQSMAEQFRGEVLSVYPGTTPSRWLPRPLYGWGQLNRLRAADQAGHVHHLYFALPYAFPYLRRLRQPVVFSVMAGVSGGPVPAWMHRRTVWVVSNERDRARLAAQGGLHIHVVRPGLNLQHLSATPPPPSGPFTLLYASAPWTKAQFASKGFDLLFAWLGQHTEARLILLWRGLHVKLLQQKLARGGLRDRVEVINQQCDIQPLLARCHAVVLLARQAKLVKAWPHSLLEGLAAGRPVVVNEAVAMADYVRAGQLGSVMTGWSATALADALAEVQADGYSAASAERRRQSIARDFRPEQMWSGYAAAYQAASTIGKSGSTPAHS